jgi:cell division protein FtsA
MPQHAENLKTRFGSALSDEVFDNRIISIPGLRGREHKEISEKNLSLIIQARMEEIFDYVYTEIANSGYGKKLVAGIVLTGGGALLRHVDKLAEYHTGLPARIGLPVEHLAHGYSEALCSPIYATAIGLLLRGIEDREKGKYKTPEKTAKSKDPEGLKIESEPTKGGFINIIIEKTREWFDAEPDSDL